MADIGFPLIDISDQSNSYFPLDRLTRLRQSALRKQIHR